MFRRRKFLKNWIEIPEAKEHKKTSLEEKA
jgi:hypothetical protein